MSSMNRRIFLGASAAMATGLSLRAADDKVSPNEKINVALVGCGGMGRANLRDFIRLPEFNIVALCDVDNARIKDAIGDLEKGNRPTNQLQTTQDFRKVVENKDVN